MANALPLRFGTAVGAVNSACLSLEHLHVAHLAGQNVCAVKAEHASIGPGPGPRCFLVSTLKTTQSGSQPKAIL